MEPQQRVWEMGRGVGKSRAVAIPILDQRFMCWTIRTGALPVASTCRLCMPLVQSSLPTQQSHLSQMVRKYTPNSKKAGGVDMQSHMQCFLSDIEVEGNLGKQLRVSPYLLIPRTNLVEDLF